VSALDPTFGGGADRGAAAGASGLGPRSILTQLGREGIVPLPGRSSVYRALVRHGLIQPQQRRRRRQDYKRWERSRAMELWQLDIVGRIRLADGTQL